MLLESYLLLPVPRAIPLILLVKVLPCAVCYLLEVSFLDDIICSALAYGDLQINLAPCLFALNFVGCFCVGGSGTVLVQRSNSKDVARTCVNPPR